LLLVELGQYILKFLIIFFGSGLYHHKSKDTDFGCADGEKKDLWKKDMERKAPEFRRETVSKNKS
jgi:hypothetical protein